MRTSPLITLLAAALLAGTASAQDVAPLVSKAPAPFARAEFYAVGSTAHLADAATLRSIAGATDYRWEGFALGAVATGILGGVVGHDLCSDDNIADKSCTGATIGGALVGALVGGVTGGLLGSLIDKH